MDKFMLAVLLGLVLVSGCKPESKNTSTNNYQSRDDKLDISREEIRGLNGVTLQADPEQNIEPSYNSRVRGLSDPESQSDW